MQYVTSIERRAIKRGKRQGMRRGKKQGLEQGLEQAVVKVLASRLGAVPDSMKELIGTVNDQARLAVLLENAATCESLEEFETVLAKAQVTSNR